MKWMFLALARSGWGEAILGLRIARRLVARGDTVVFVIHPALAKAFRGEPVRVEVLGDEQGPAFTRRLHQLLVFHGSRAVVLSDLLMTVTALLRRRAPEALALPIPVIGIDTWHLREIGGVLDTQPDEVIALAPHLVNHPTTLVPVPFCRPSAANAAVVLPEGTPLTTAEKQAARTDLGLPHGPLIALTTAGWQLRDTGDERITRFQRWLPERLAGALRQTTADVVHVGPTPLELTGVRVHHRARLAAPDFERLIASTDLLLSTNASASTNATAAVFGVPVLTVVHSGAPVGDIPWPFQSWPVGWNQALTRLLHDNPWARVLNRHEVVVDGTDTIASALEGMLPGGRLRESTLDSAAAALSVLRAVDPPEAVLDRHC
jgi:hypothetical protein